MTSLETDLWLTAGMLALLGFLVAGTLFINGNRKARIRSRKLAARLLNWK